MLRVIGVVDCFYVSAFKKFANQCCFLSHVRECKLFFAFVIILTIYILLIVFYDF